MKKQWKILIIAVAIIVVCGGAVAYAATERTDNNVQKKVETKMPAKKVEANNEKTKTEVKKDVPKKEVKLKTTETKNNKPIEKKADDKNVTSENNDVKKEKTTSENTKQKDDVNQNLSKATPNKVAPSKENTTTNKKAVPVKETTATVQKTVPSKENNKETDWVSKLNVANTTNQLVTVQVYDFKRAIVQYHVKTNGVWNQVFSTNEGWIGYGGLTNPSTRHEGNGTTPYGVYTFGSAFGAQQNPGTVFTYHRLHPDSYWDADFGTPLFNHYNTWNPGSNWNKAGAEPLWANEAVAYQYAISINYNTFNPQKGLGNAIFLHCTVGGGTAGCVGIPEHYVVYLLQHLDKQAKIVISTKEGIYNY